MGSDEALQYADVRGCLPCVLDNERDPGCEIVTGAEKILAVDGSPRVTDGRRWHIGNRERPGDRQPRRHIVRSCAERVLDTPSEVIDFSSAPESSRSNLI
jgi:hypothetical protein